MTSEQLDRIAREWAAFLTRVGAEPGTWGSTTNLQTGGERVTVTWIVDSAGALVTTFAENSPPIGRAASDVPPARSWGDER